MDEKEKQKLIEKYRDINVDYEWYQYTFDDFIARMEKVGIEVDNIHFSGFYSQGDGACFEGRIHRPLRFMRKHCPGQYPMIRKLIVMKGYLNVGCTHSGQYYHAESTVFDMNYEEFWTFLDAKDEMRESVIEVMDEQLNREFDDFYNDVKNVFRGYMNELYHELRDEYEHLTSDDVVWESIVANELHLPELETQ